MKIFLKQSNGNKATLSAPSIPDTSKIVVYTALFAGRDPIKPCPGHVGASWIMFTDEPGPAHGWNKVVTATALDPRRTARVFKMLPHVWFPNADITIWIDATVRICEVEALLELTTAFPLECNVGAFKHATRSCLYQEAKACIRKSNDEPADIRRQIANYRSSGMPVNAGLYDTSFLVRRNNDAMRAFNEKWLKHILRFSARDQLSFSYLANLMAMHVYALPGTARHNRFMKRYWHPIWRFIQKEKAASTTYTLPGRAEINWVTRETDYMAIAGRGQ